MTPEQQTTHIVAHASFKWYSVLATWVKYDVKGFTKAEHAAVKKGPMLLRSRSLVVLITYDWIRTAFSFLWTRGLVPVLSTSPFRYHILLTYVLILLYAPVHQRCEITEPVSVMSALLTSQVVLRTAWSEWPVCRECNGRGCLGCKPPFPYMPHGDLLRHSGLLAALTPYRMGALPPIPLPSQGTGYTCCRGSTAGDGQHAGCAGLKFSEAEATPPPYQLLGFSSLLQTQRQKAEDHDRVCLW